MVDSPIGLTGRFSPSFKTLDLVDKTKEQKVVNIDQYIGYRLVSLSYCKMIVDWFKNRYNIKKIIDISVKYNVLKFGPDPPVESIGPSIGRFSAPVHPLGRSAI